MPKLTVSPLQGPRFAIEALDETQPPFKLEGSGPADADAPIAREKAAAEGVGQRQVSGRHTARPAPALEVAPSDVDDDSLP